MESTTIKVSVQTRERLRSYGGATYEDTVIEALDALDDTRFWAQADLAAMSQHQSSPDRRRARQLEVDAVDAAFDGIE